MAEIKNKDGQKGHTEDKLEEIMAMQSGLTRDFKIAEFAKELTRVETVAKEAKSEMKEIVKDMKNEMKSEMKGFVDNAKSEIKDTKNKLDKKIYFLISVIVAGFFMIALDYFYRNEQRNREVKAEIVNMINSKEEIGGFDVLEHRVERMERILDNVSQINIEVSVPRENK